MSTLVPAEVQLLMLLHFSPDPFADLGEAHAGSPTIRRAMDRFANRGWLSDGVDWGLLDRVRRRGFPVPDGTPLLSPKGTALVHRICNTSLDNLLEEPNKP